MRRQRPLAGAGTHLVRRIKGNPSKAASKATQHSVWGAMHFLVAVGYLVFVHPAHQALLVRWLPGMAYLIIALSYLGIAWRARERARPRSRLKGQPDASADSSGAR